MREAVGGGCGGGVGGGGWTGLTAAAAALASSSSAEPQQLRQLLAFVDSALLQLCSHSSAPASFPAHSSANVNVNPNPTAAPLKVKTWVNGGHNAEERREALTPTSAEAEWPLYPQSRTNSPGGVPRHGSVPSGPRCRQNQDTSLSRLSAVEGRFRRPFLPPSKERTSTNIQNCNSEQTSPRDLIMVSNSDVLDFLKASSHFAALKGIFSMDDIRNLKTLVESGSEIQPTDSTSRLMLTQRSPQVVANHGNREEDLNNVYTDMTTRCAGCSTSGVTSTNSTSQGLLGSLTDREENAQFDQSGSSCSCETSLRECLAYSDSIRFETSDFRSCYDDSDVARTVDVLFRSHLSHESAVGSSTQKLTSSDTSDLSHDTTAPEKQLSNRFSDNVAVSSYNAIESPWRFRNSDVEIDSVSSSNRLVVPNRSSSSEANRSPGLSPNLTSDCDGRGRPRMFDSDPDNLYVVEGSQIHDKLVNDAPSQLDGNYEILGQPFEIASGPSCRNIISGHQLGEIDNEDLLHFITSENNEVKRHNSSVETTDTTAKNGTIRQLFTADELCKRLAAGIDDVKQQVSVSGCDGVKQTDGSAGVPRHRFTANNKVHHLADKGVIGVSDDKLVSGCDDMRKIFSGANVSQNFSVDKTFCHRAAKNDEHYVRDIEISTHKINDLENLKKPFGYNPFPLNISVSDYSHIHVSNSPEQPCDVRRRRTSQQSTSIVTEACQRLNDCVAERFCNNGSPKPTVSGKDMCTVAEKPLHKLTDNDCEYDVHNIISAHQLIMGGNSLEHGKPITRSTISEHLIEAIDAISRECQNDHETSFSDADAVGSQLSQQVIIQSMNKSGVPEMIQGDCKLISSSSEDLISFDNFTSPLSPRFRSADREEASRNCLICDDISTPLEWNTGSINLPVLVEEDERSDQECSSGIETGPGSTKSQDKFSIRSSQTDSLLNRAKKRDVTFAESSSEIFSDRRQRPGVSKVQNRSNIRDRETRRSRNLLSMKTSLADDETLKKIDEVIHAVLRSLSSDKFDERSKKKHESEKLQTLSKPDGKKALRITDEVRDTGDTASNERVSKKVTGTRARKIPSSDYDIGYRAFPNNQVSSKATSPIIIEEQRNNADSSVNRRILKSSARRRKSLSWDVVLGRENDCGLTVRNEKTLKNAALNHKNRDLNYLRESRPVTCPYGRNLRKEDRSPRGLRGNRESDGHSTSPDGLFVKSRKNGSRVFEENRANDGVIFPFGRVSKRATGSERNLSLEDLRESRDCVGPPCPDRHIVKSRKKVSPYDSERKRESSAKIPIGKNSRRKKSPRVGHYEEVNDRSVSKTSSSNAPRTVGQTGSAPTKPTLSAVSSRNNRDFSFKKDSVSLKSAPCSSCPVGKISAPRQVRSASLGTGLPVSPASPNSSSKHIKKLRTRPLMKLSPPPSSLHSARRLPPALHLQRSSPSPLISRSSSPSTYVESSFPPSRTSTRSVTPASPRTRTAIKNFSAFVRTPFKASSLASEKPRDQGLRPASTLLSQSQSSLVMEPLMPLVSQIANAAARTEDQSDMVLISPRDRAYREVRPSKTSTESHRLETGPSAVCIELVGEEMKIHSALSSLVPEERRRRYTDVGTMTDPDVPSSTTYKTALPLPATHPDSLLPSSGQVPTGSSSERPVSAKSPKVTPPTTPRPVGLPRGITIGGGDCVVVVRPQGPSSPSSPTPIPSASVILRPRISRSQKTRKRRRCHEVVTTSTSSSSSAPSPADRDTSARLNKRKWSVPFRSTRRHRRAALELHRATTRRKRSLLRRNLLLTLCLSMLSLTFGSLSFNIVCEPT